MSDSKLDKGNSLISKLIDVKFFGGMIPEEARIIGNIQCEWSRSLHPINIQSYAVSSAFSSKEDKKSGSFGSRYMIPYGLYGGSFIYSASRNANMIYNYNDGLSCSDLSLFDECLINGCSNGRSGVKGFIEPLLILKVVKNENVKNRYDGFNDFLNLDILSDPIIDSKCLNLDLKPLRRFLEKEKSKFFERIEVYCSESGKRNYKDLLNISKKYNGFSTEESDLNCCIEYLIIYEVRYGNPNGDPLMDNMPRVLEGTEIGLISPERQKRWIRDYLEESKNELILISRNTKVQKAKDRLKEIENIFK